MQTVTVPTVAQRLARIVMAGTLAVSLGASALCAPGQALAVENGSVTIEARDAGDLSNSFKVYQVFIAQGGIDKNDKASRLQWNDSLKASVLAYLNANGYAEWLSSNGHVAKSAANLPQNAAEFISERIQTGAFDPADADSPLTPAGGSFATGLARALSSVDPTVPSYTAGDVFTNSEGYYLFVSKASDVKADEAGTAPIWVPLGGSTDKASIAEKSAVPSLTKEVKEDSSGAWGPSADANMGQDLEFRLTATMPDNIGAFSAYHCMFVDTLPAGMELPGGNVSSVRVKVDGKDVTSSVKNPKGAVTYEGNVLTVDLTDVLTLDKTLSIAKGSTVSVEYRAHLTKDSVVGSGGNRNEAKLYYPKDPVSLVMADPAKPDEGTTGKQANTYTYRLALNKVDKQTAEPLAGAKFTVQVADENSDSASKGKYVNASGQLVDTAYAFTTDAKGNFEVPRIDEGTYIVHETQAPKGYKASADMKVQITSTFNATTGALDVLSAAVTGGEGSADVALSSDVVTHLVGAPDMKTGKVSVQTSNDKIVEMPVTGMDGVAAATVYGSGAVALGLVGWFASRRKRRMEDVGEIHAPESDCR